MSDFNSMTDPSQAGVQDAPDMNNPQPPAQDAPPANTRPASAFPMPQAAPPDQRGPQSAASNSNQDSNVQSVANRQTLRTLLANRKNELVGDNRYLQRQYGVTAAPAAQPSGRPVIQNGKVIGYTTDGKTMTPVQ